MVDMGAISRSEFPDFPEEADHEVLAFVTPDASIDFADLSKLLHQKAQAHDAKFATYRWAGVIDQVAVYADGWIVLVNFQEDNLVAGDLRDMASRYYGEHPQAAEMARCRCRVDIYVSDPEVHVAAFDCLDTAREWLKAQPGVIAIDPETGEDV
jgi:hypothetical protein